MKSRNVPFAPDDCVYTLDEFQSAVDSGMFIDYDGYGYLADSRSYEFDRDSIVKPSTFTRLRSTFPSWATHIVWMNR